MFNRCIQQLLKFFDLSGRRRTMEAALFTLSVLPFVLLGAFNISDAHFALTENALHHAGMDAHSASQLVKERVDGLVNLGVSLASRVQFRELIRTGRWRDSAGLLEQVTRDFPQIERIFLTDTSGILRADTPALPGVEGRDFSDRDWYRGVSQEWLPYVSNVYQRLAEPRYNVVAIAIPVWNSGDRNSRDSKPIGILVMQLELRTFNEWSKEIHAEPGSHIFFVDRMGQAISHPQFPLQGRIVDLSREPGVRKVIGGEEGTEQALVDGKDTVVAFAPVAGYGWGTLISRDSDEAFAERDSVRILLFSIYGIIILLALLATYFLVNIIRFLSTSQQTQRIFLESIGDGVFAIDRKWKVVLWNKAAETLTGWKKEEVMERPLREVLRFVEGDTRRENMIFLEEAMLFGEARQMLPNMIIIGKNGRELAAGDSAAPIFDSSGQVEGAIVAFRDISKERDLERSKTDFISTLAHQLRTPPTVIKGYLEMLGDKNAGMDPETKGHLDAIRAANEKMIDLAGAMMNVFRIDFGTFAVSPEPVVLAELADQALKQLGPMLSEKKLKLEKEYDPDLPVLNLDPKLIQLILQNLLTNSVKYTPEGGIVRLSLVRKDKETVIRVADTGYGIPLQEQNRVFERFYRASNVRELEGTGLGLYIVKSVVEQSGGKIWFESPGRGSVFYVSFPPSGMIPRKGAKGLS